MSNTALKILSSITISPEALLLWKQLTDICEDSHKAKTQDDIQAIVLRLQQLPRDLVNTCNLDIRRLQAYTSLEDKVIEMTKTNTDENTSH